MHSTCFYNGVGGQKQAMSRPAYKDVLKGPTAQVTFPLAHVRRWVKQPTLAYITYLICSHL